MKKLLIVLFCFFITTSQSFAKETVKYNKGIYHIVIPGQDINRVKFILSSKLVRNEEIHKKENSILTINTGFFDPHNQKTISYIYNDGFLTESPLENENLTNNEYIMNNWDKISNRAEFRILKNNNNLVPQITFHNSDSEFEVLTSAQGGPMLLPQMDLENECFIVKNKDGKIIRESASVLHKTARTLIGIKDSDIHILIVTNKNPMTIYEAQELCKKYKLDSAMAFDGGSSTSLDYKDKVHVTSVGIKTDDTGRKVKSFMIFR